MEGVDNLLDHLGVGPGRPGHREVWAFGARLLNTGLKEAVDGIDYHDQPV